MIGFALQLGTDAAAATMVQLAGLGTRQARAMRNLFALPFTAMDAAVEAAFGPRPKRLPVRTNPPAAAAAPLALAVEFEIPDTFQCPEEETLAAYADHGLMPEEQSRVESHLVECEACRYRVAIVVGAPEPEEVCTAYRA